MPPRAVVLYPPFGNALFSIDHAAPDGSCLLRGLDSRLLISASTQALAIAKPAQVQDAARRFHQTLDTHINALLARRPLPPKGCGVRYGKVLHIDADEDYLRICAMAYARLSIPCACAAAPESRQAEAVPALLRTHQPDVLVLTGHDAYESGEHNGNYQASAHFTDAVHTARQFAPLLDDLAIVAGACQSDFERLMDAGANAASAPRRIRIHALDPLLIAAEIACTSIDTILSPPAIIAASISGPRGFGAVQTRGAARLFAPCTANIGGDV